MCVCVLHNAQTDWCPVLLRRPRNRAAGLLKSLCLKPLIRGFPTSSLKSPSVCPGLKGWADTLPSPHTSLCLLWGGWEGETSFVGWEAAHSSRAGEGRVRDGGRFCGGGGGGGVEETWLLMKKMPFFFFFFFYQEVSQSTGARKTRGHTRRRDYERIVSDGGRLSVTGEVKSSVLLSLWPLTVTAFFVCVKPLFYISFVFYNSVLFYDLFVSSLSGGVAGRTELVGKCVATDICVPANHLSRFVLPASPTFLLHF